MTEETWHQARLIPTSGISGAEEQERRATSALLAVMGVVKEFSRTVLAPLGAPAGNVETFIEVPFALGEKRLYPDGLIRVTRGSRTWTALVEVKTGKNDLQTEQLENYLDIAREQEFDALITISNEIPAIVGQHPTKVDKRKLRRVEIFHWSWSYLLSTAVVQKEHRGVSDPEQAWILGELIRYLEHPKSGALEFVDMGQHWVGVRNAVADGTLRATDRTLSDVVSRFDALIRFASLQLGRQLGTEVVPLLSRKELADPALRSASLTESVVATGDLGGALRIPNAIGPVHLTANLRAGQITCHIDIEAPKEGRSTTRVNWLVRQLKHAPADVRVESFVVNGRGAGAAELLSSVREDPALLILDPKRDLKSFRVARTVSMGAKGGRGRGSFIDSVLDLIDGFYGDVVQHLKGWTAAPPKLREPEPAPIALPPALNSTALSSQDGPETDSDGSSDSASSPTPVLACAVENAVAPV
ncbi:hypothetical protein [Nocardioides sp. Root140]|uniref:hypothetical protein n=1 Tax=Nocardioides sp. Root140 TaxID=1736460 RepID=UPI0006FFEEB0|nr:hypothetical protein [Nocardioides sp. Root140]KQY56692.1 hypothetical protein ASD30_10280 [Nocardioides sp. Root140]